MLSSHNFSTEIDTLFLSDHLRKEGYTNLLYQHLTAMNQFPLLSGNTHISTMLLNDRTYLGLTEFVLGHSSILEHNEPADDVIDWDNIDNMKDKLMEKIKHSLRSEVYTDMLKPIIKSTLDMYEHFMIYDYMHNQSMFNPWLPTKDILFNNGYMILLSENKEIVREYDKKILDKVKEDSSDLFVVAVSKKEKAFSGFPIDTRNTAQGLVYEYLKKEAKGRKNVKNIKQIENYLISKQKNYSILAIKNKVLLPLKREGLIGSTTAGYFYIDSKDDFMVTYQHHVEKLRGIEKTVKMYEIQAEKKGIILQNDRVACA